MSSPTIPRRRQRSDSSGHEASEPPSSSPPLSHSKRPRLNLTNGIEASSDEAEKSDSDNESTSHTLSVQDGGNRRQDLASAGENDSESDQSSNDEGEDSDDNDKSEAQRDAQPANEEDDMPPPPKQPLRALPGLGPDGYKPGAIVRIKVTNFVTYKTAEFFPGPKLNMVIGPNGTGKSTLVCAICLGLGWGPQHLGRAKDTGEFVKHGYEEATIEIELERAPGKSRNPVITRTIKRDGNKSSFTLNGTPTSRNVVLKLAQSFAIQVDNLCQFLPQDKVAEFAALSPVDLLHSTQRAAAGEDMIKNHESLKDLRREQKKIQAGNRGDQQDLRDLKKRQDDQSADVEKMRKRAEVQEKIEMINKLRPLVELNDHSTKFRETRAAKDKEEEEYKQLKSDLEPALAAVSAKAAYKDRVLGVKNQRKRQVQQLSKVASARGKNVEDLERSIQEINNTIDAEKKSNGTVREKVMKLTQEINVAKRRQQEGPVEFDIDYYNSQLSEKRREIRRIDEAAQEIHDKKLPLAREKTSLTNAIKEEERMLSSLDSRMGQQEVKLQRLSEDTFKAHRWILENQSKFEGVVFPPPIISCSVTNPRYASAVESLFNKNDYLTFTTQNTADFRTLQKHLVSEQGLSDISIKTCASLTGLSRPRPNLNLQRLGLDGWAQDFLTGPDYVIASLCDSNALRRTPVGLRDISEQAFNELEGTREIGSWVAGQKFYKVARRADIGAWATSTQTKKIRPAHVWTSQPIDASVKQGHEDKIGELKVRLAQINEEMEGQRTKLQELSDEKKGATREQQTIETEKDKKQTAYTEYRAIPHKLASLEERKAREEERHMARRQKVIDLRNQQDKKAIERAEAAIEYAVAVEKFQKAFQELIQVEVLSLEAASEHQAVQIRHHDYGKRIEQKLVSLKALQARFEEEKVKGRILRRAKNKAIEEAAQTPLGQELLEMMDAEGVYSMINLEADLESAQAELHFNVVSGGAGLIQEFEERAQKIERLEAKLATFQQQLNNLQTAIDEVRAAWEPKLDALIAKISDAFSDSFQRIGCAGSVGLDKVETDGENGEPGGVEFDRWAIEIKVQFRENAGLSLLDSHRQSGGERAVSTIFYLMALQSLSASPFRVVDEINQGMDPRNERMVHGRLVDIACASAEEADTIGGGGGGQYFLITPKLLPGLSYKPGMRVLCIWSGEHMPADYGKLNVSLAIRKMKEVLANKSPSSSAASSSQGPSQSQTGVYA